VYDPHDGPLPWEAPEVRDAEDLAALEGEPAQERLPSELPRALRPREKLLARGAGHLAHGELLALVLGSGTRRDPAARVAERLLRRHGLKGLAELEPGRLRSERGIGTASAARLSAAFELGRRAAARDARDERPRVSKPKDAFLQVRDLGRARKEHLVGIYLDAQNGVLKRETISVGSLNTTRTHPREILYPAIVHLALGFILAHNHPSGCLEPSDEDVEFTRAVHRAGELMGIELHDHLIVTRGGYTSLKERGIF
jgi:DNA repair protein RadC